MAGPSVELCGCMRITNASASILFALFAIITGVGVNVVLPLFANSVGHAGPYFVLVYGSFWFAVLFFLILLLLRLFTNQVRPDNTYEVLGHLDMFWVGFTTSLNGVLIVFASPTYRTPGFLQALLVNVSIPMTIGLRYLILGKGVNWKQTVAAGIVMVGIFIALVPSIFGTGGGDSGPESALARILWPIIFMVGFAPGSIQTIVTEKGLKPQTLEEQVALLEAEESTGHQHLEAGYPSKVSPLAMDAGKEKRRRSTVSRNLSTTVSTAMPTPDSSVHLMYFMAWSNLYQFLVNVALFWADLIPGFGEATASTLFEGLSFGVRCVFASAPECSGGHAMAMTITFIICYMTQAVAAGLLVRQSEGANYVALVGSATTPIGALFWTLFKSQPLRFDPTLSTTTYYSLAGLAVMVPGIIYYNRHSDGPAH